MDNPRTRSGLLGHDQSRSVLMLGVTVVLFLIVLALGIVAGQQGWLTTDLVLVVLTILVGGSLIAAINAYWNDGLLLSWTLVFAPVMAWAWHVASLTTGPSVAEVVAEAGAYGVLAALFIGTPGYAVGRMIRTYSKVGGFSTPSGWFSCLLLGYDMPRIRRGLVAVVVLLLIPLGFLALLQLSVPWVRDVYFSSLPVPVQFFYPVGAIGWQPVLGMIVTLVWIGLAALPAYRNYGLLMSWLLVFGLILIPLMIGTPGAYAAVLAVGSALTTGTIGFFIGRGSRRIFHSHPTALFGVS